MKKNILFIFLSLLTVIKVNAQADCFFKYCYIGKVSLNTKATNSNDIFVQLPSPELMLNIVDKSKGFFKAKISDQLNFERESVTTGSSDFCGTLDNIIEKILKGSNRVYTIYIIKGGKKYRKNINIKDIEFSHNDYIIYIRLPQIRI